MAAGKEVKVSNLEHSVGFITVDREKPVESHECQKMLFLLENDSDVIDYIRVYISTYNEHKKTNPKEIIFSNCDIRCEINSNLFKSYPQNENFQNLLKESILKFKGCKLSKTHELSDNSIKECKFIDSYMKGISSCPGNIKLKAVNCFFEEISSSHGTQGNKIFLNCIIKRIKGNTNNIAIGRNSRILESVELSSRSVKISSSVVDGKAKFYNDNQYIDLLSIDHFDVSNTIFKGEVELQKIDFRGAANFSNTKFKTPPKLINVEFNGRNINFENVECGDLKTPEALGSYRALKHKMEKFGYEHGAIIFHGYELETHYNVYLREKKWVGEPESPEKVSSFLHKKLTDYGRDLW